MTQNGLAILALWLIFRYFLSYIRGPLESRLRITFWGYVKFTP